MAFKDIDNRPKNTTGVKVKKDGEAKVSGKLVTVNPSLLQMLIGAADYADSKVTPKADLHDTDFFYVMVEPIDQ